MLSPLLSSVLLPDPELQFTRISGRKSACWRLSAFWFCHFGGGKGFGSAVELQFECGMNTSDGDDVALFT